MENVYYLWYNNDFIPCLQYKTDKMIYGFLDQFREDPYEVEYINF